MTPEHAEIDGLARGPEETMICNVFLASDARVCRLSRLAGAILAILYYAAALSAQTEPTIEAPLTERERALLNRIDALERRLAAVETKIGAPATGSTFLAVPGVASSGNSNTTATAGSTSDASNTLGIGGATLNFYLDGYYSWNFNRPVGRVNLLRANDVLSNNFSLNQIGLIVDRPPDVAAGRRFGGRVDLMFGQNTETMQGGGQNESRPQVYRHIFQAYGTYVFPLGSGLTVDFGKFNSALGFENNYAYDEINYSRSFYFGYLPYYHMGFRSTYRVNSGLTVQHWLVNGGNQTEDFNGAKSNAFLFTLKPAKTVSWNINYYFGQEGRHLTPEYNPGLPSLPTQPGLSVTSAPGPKSNGRSHIFDTYVSWSPDRRVTFAAELDYVVSRARSHSPPSTVSGGAGYLQYRFTPKFSLAARFEYLRDRGGLFSGAKQDLKEHTATATYQLADGFQLRLEHRRDFSNQPFFLSRTNRVLNKEQNSATIALIWWFGGKRESW
jgi:hypothetical protein